MQDAALERITLVENHEQCVQASIVVEAIFEDLDAKRVLFAGLALVPVPGAQRAACVCARAGASRPPVRYGLSNRGTTELDAAAARIGVDPVLSSNSMNFTVGQITQGVTAESRCTAPMRAAL